MIEVTLEAMGAESGPTRGRRDSPPQVVLTTAFAKILPLFSHLSCLCICSRG